MEYEVRTYICNECLLEWNSDCDEGCCPVCESDNLSID
jgi:Zn finger protein HypA/HybF involved in hydrogenase expression